MNFGSTTPPKGIVASDWAGILAAHEKAQQRIESQANGTFAMRNASQQWQMRFDAQGFTAQPDRGGNWQWSLELHHYGYGTQNITLSPKDAQVTTEENRLVYRRDQTLSEWYVNRREGLLHGWTLANRPDGSASNNALLELALKVRGTLRPQLTGEQEDAVTFTDSKGTVVLNYSGLKAWDANGQFLSVHFKVSNGSLIVRVDDRRARYPVTIDPTVQQAYLKASNTETNDFFGISVAISGDTVVVGASGEDSNGINGNQADNTAGQSGAAYVFLRNNGTWFQQAYLKASNPEGMDRFGSSVAISGDTIIVGAYGEDSDGVNGQNNNASTDSGAAYVFVRTNGTWAQMELGPNNLISKLPI